MRGLIIKSVVLTVLFIAGLYAFKYLLKYSIRTVFDLPQKAKSVGFSLSGYDTDTNIVLVNIGRLDRGLIAETVNSLSEASPKVLAFNICFDRNNVTPFDSLLFSSFQKERNVVLFREGDYCECSGEVHYGKEDFQMESDGIVKSFINDTTSLSAVVVKLYNKNVYEKLKKRKTKKELINYIGNHTHFISVNAENVLTGSFDKSLFQNKIILLGYLGSFIPDPQRDTVDTYETPYNLASSSKMYGTEISANIIHTIIHEKFITVIPLLVCYGIYLLLLVFNSFFGYLALKKSQRFFAFTISLLVLFEGFIAAIIMIILFRNNIILHIEDLPFIILGGFLVQYFILQYQLANHKKSKTS